MYILLTRRYDADFRYALAYFSPMAVKCGAHLRQAKLPFAGVSDVFFLGVLLLLIGTSQTNEIIVLKLT